MQSGMINDAASPVSVNQNIYCVEVEYYSYNHLGPLEELEQLIKLVQSNHLYPMMKHWQWSVPVGQSLNCET